MSFGTNVESIQRYIEDAFPHQRVASVEPLSGGLRNTNLKIEFSSKKAPIVLRLYKEDSSICLKEIEILRLLRSAVPVPEVLHARPEGIDGSRPFIMMPYIEGLTFQQLKRTGDLTAIHQASASVGQTLAAIAAYEFSKPGRLIATLRNELEVGQPYTRSSDPIPEILDNSLNSPVAQHRLGAGFAQRLHDFIWAWAPLLPDITNVSKLVHSDFGNRNIIVNEVNGSWRVAAVLDWEFAFSGSPLLDIGNFLRYDLRHEPLREPYFSQSFVEHGGNLPDNWSNIVRVIDLTALVDCLTHEYLPDDVAAEIVQLINSTLDECPAES
jgi:aminoglycoside phosphotransferase (APT) family kinase protein